MMRECLKIFSLLIVRNGNKYGNFIIYFIKFRKEFFCGILYFTAEITENFQENSAVCKYTASELSYNNVINLSLAK